MILEYRIDETKVQSAWLKTLYDLVEELNLKCQTFFEEGYNCTRKCFSQTRVVKITGSNPMLGWFKLRLERYNHFINSLNDYAEFYSSSLEHENQDNEETA